LTPVAGVTPQSTEVTVKLGCIAVSRCDGKEPVESEDSTGS
jgi:hypothetical protein